MDLPYRPSNGTEGELFMEQFCHQCERDRTWREQSLAPCPILSRALVCHPEVDGVGDQPGQFPREWREDSGGPYCTAFLAEPGVPAGRIDDRRQEEMRL